MKNTLSRKWMETDRIVNSRMKRCLVRWNYNKAIPGKFRKSNGRDCSCWSCRGELKDPKEIRCFMLRKYGFDVCEKVSKELELY